MRNYEGISIELNARINERLNRLESDVYVDSTIQTERQYSFLTFLQSLPLAEKQVFTIYTNTKLK